MITSNKNNLQLKREKVDSGSFHMNITRLSMFFSGFNVVAVRCRQHFNLGANMLLGYSRAGLPEVGPRSQS